MRRLRLLAAATVIAASLITPSAILAAAPAADPAGGVTAPVPQAPEAARPVRADSGAKDRGSSAGSAEAARVAVSDATVVKPAAAAKLLAAGNGESSPATASATPAASVTIQDYFFSPKTVTINAGETVRWDNKGKAKEGHTVTAEDNSFDSGVLKQGQAYSHKFSKTGTFSYLCELHPNMVGKVVVESAATGGGGDGGNGSGRSSNDGGISSSGTSGTSTDTSSGGSLPYTGQDLRIALVIGVNLMLAGFLLLLRSRRSSPRG